MQTAIDSRRYPSLAIALPVALGFSAVAYATPVPNEIFADGFDPPPVANFNYGATGLAVTFTDTSTDTNAPIGTWTWDFGDGGTSTMQNPVHTFSAAGTYTVSETVVDGTNGESDLTSKMVKVVPCGTLTLYLHDFKAVYETGGHPDFEAYAGAATGLVYSTITPGGVPTLQSTTGNGSTQVVTSALTFAQWFTDDPINYPIQQTLTLAENPPGTFSYSSNAYFPIDGEGFGNLTGYSHNYDFTTMLHTQFQYSGGETFTFIGDDDVWVYINGHLAIDLGGVHAPETGSVTLDAATATTLGLTLGQTYKLDFFQAQRHVIGSNFTLDTTIQCLTDAH